MVAEFFEIERALAFTVAEGSQVAVREIRFSGNTAVSSQTLKGKLSLKESGFLQAGAFQESKLEDDKKAIVDYYKSRGYVDAAVEDVVRSYEKDAKTSKSWLILTIALKEGKQWTYGGIGFFHRGTTLQEWLIPLVCIQWAKKALKTGIVLKPIAEITTQAASIGYPVFVKAVAGGGGKGMRLVSAPEEVDEAMLLFSLLPTRRPEQLKKGRRVKLRGLSWNLNF